MLNFFYLLAFFILEGIAFVEPLHPAGRINNFLRARHKGVTLGAYLHSDIFLRGLGGNHIAAYATDGCFRIFRMNTLLHRLSSLLLTDL